MALSTPKESTKDLCDLTCRNGTYLTSSEDGHNGVSLEQAGNGRDILMARIILEISVLPTEFSWINTLHFSWVKSGGLGVASGSIL